MIITFPSKGSNPKRLKRLMKSDQKQIIQLWRDIIISLQMLAEKGYLEMYVNEKEELVCRFSAYLRKYIQNYVAEVTTYGL